MPIFAVLKYYLDAGVHGIVRNNRIDLSCAELWDNGILEV